MPNDLPNGDDSEIERRLESEREWRDSQAKSEREGIAKSKELFAATEAYLSSQANAGSQKAQCGRTGVCRSCRVCEAPNPRQRTRRRSQAVLRGEVYRGTRPQSRNTRARGWNRNFDAPTGYSRETRCTKDVALGGRRPTRVCGVQSRVVVWRTGVARCPGRHWDQVSSPAGFAIARKTSHRHRELVASQFCLTQPNAATSALHV